MVCLQKLPIIKTIIHRLLKPHNRIINLLLPGSPLLKKKLPNILKELYLSLKKPVSSGIIRYLL